MPSNPSPIDILRSALAENEAAQTAWIMNRSGDAESRRVGDSEFNLCQAYRLHLKSVLDAAESAVPK